MSKFDKHNSMIRFYIIAAVMVCLAIGVIAKATYIMTAKRAYWEEVAGRLKNDSLEAKPIRGNIVTEKGELLASSLPRYEVFIDFKTMHTSGVDSLWMEKRDSICEGLSRIFPSMTAKQFMEHLEAGKDSLKSHWPIYKGRISFSDFDEVRKLPIFRLNKYKGGFHSVEHNARRRPYGDLASRTIGEMYGLKDTARSGIELFCDTLLRGKVGYYNRRKVLAQYLNVKLSDPTNGADIVSCLDINTQDLAERSLRKKLHEINGVMGVAIVMEVATGDIKAMTSLTRCADGEYREIQNNAVSAMVEPGSVFKTASIMALLEDGYIDTTRTVDTGGGIWEMYGRKMRDHNWQRGGYGTLTVPKVLQVSSNIGVSRLVDQYYKDKPEKYVERLKSMGMGIEMQLPFFFDNDGNAVKTSARIRMPHKDEHGKYTNWWKTALPWMSIGYECQVPPIYMVSFYNAIANNGRFMQPRFIKEVRKDGEMIQAFEPVCLIDKMCSQQTLDKIRPILESVVSRGLGKGARSDKFKVAGKTGTAQVADENGVYGTGAMRYWLSFCGYFPYDNPKYTCIVCLKKVGLPASGGGMCGPVFKEIAEGVMAQNIKYPANSAYDANSILIPDVKNGNLYSADYVLNMLGIQADNGWNGNTPAGTPAWGTTERKEKSVALNRKESSDKTKVPDVTGMGARDAVFILESRGIKVIVNGRGKVKEQSIAAGTGISKGMKITLRMG